MPSMIFIYYYSHQQLCNNIKVIIKQTWLKIKIKLKNYCKKTCLHHVKKNTSNVTINQVLWWEGLLQNLMDVVDISVRQG